MRERLAAVGLMLLVTTAACTSDDPATDAAAPADAPAPLAADADGAAVYAARCAECHGDDLRGTHRGPSQLSIVYEPGHHGDDSYRRAIRNGVPQHHWEFGDMPIVEAITDEQIERVIGFIRAEQERQGFE